MTAGKILDNIRDAIHSFIVRTFIVPLVTRFFKPMVDGTTEQLTVEFTTLARSVSFGGQRKSAENNNEGNQVTLYIDNPIHFCWLLLLDQKIGLGEAYMDGDWRAVPGIKAFLTCLIRAKREKAAMRTGKRGPRSLSFSIAHFLLNKFISFLRAIVASYNYICHRIRDNTIMRSRKNISEHYDLGNEMFQLFLDPSMTYSCALFENVDSALPENDDNKELEEAQIRKVDSLIESLQLTPADHVLEIGCGWGTAAIRAVQKYGCKWTGLTISTEQLELAQGKIRDVGLEDKIELKLLDYRLEEGTYTAIVSIEMIEAVGERFLPQYFSVLHDRLEKGGKAAIQAIVCPDAYYDRYCRSSDFIKKHIFPGGHLPSIGAIHRSLPKDDNDEVLFEVEMGKRMAKHYARTLDTWLSTWNSKEKEIVRLGYSTTFHRKWQFYFGLCSSLFEYDHIDVIQFTLNKN